MAQEDKRQEGKTTEGARHGLGERLRRAQPKVRVKRKRQNPLSVFLLETEWTPSLRKSRVEMRQPTSVEITQGQNRVVLLAFVEIAWVQKKEGGGGKPSAIKNET